MGDAAGVIFWDEGKLVDANSKALASEGGCDRVHGAGLQRCTMFCSHLPGPHEADLREQIS